MKFKSAVFYSNDLERSANYYQHVLGLTKTRSQKDLFIAFVFENGIELILKKTVDDRDKPGHQSIIIEIDGIVALYQKFRNEPDTRFNEDLQKYDWGTHFSILDPDSNKIEFLQI